MSNKEEWVKVGNFGVDAGLCWIGDPCYLSEGRGSMNDWDNFCNKLWEGDNPNSPTMKQFDDGCVVSTGFGDGCYDVFAKVVDLGLWGKRIEELKVIFINEEEEEEEE